MVTRDNWIGPSGTYRLVREQTDNAKSKHHLLTYNVVNRDRWFGPRKTASGLGQTAYGNNEHFGFPISSDVRRDRWFGQRRTDWPVRDGPKHVESSLDIKW